MSLILLVEDESELAAVIQRELTAAGYSLLHAADGLAALELHAVHQPDAVILDWMLPKLDGLAVLAQIRQSAATPVLMLTARSEEADRIAGLKAGADDYLPKPFSIEELKARLEALLRRADLIRHQLESDRRAAQEVITQGDLSLDPAAYQLSISGAVVELTRTEFELLHLLLRNPGRSFTRNYLMETIWSAESAGGDRAVDSAITRLRKKLGKWGGMIEAKWGVGYRWRRP